MSTKSSVLQYFLGFYPIPESIAGGWRITRREGQSSPAVLAAARPPNEITLRYAAFCIPMGKSPGEPRHYGS